jgi:anti-sigma B factor antagonist
MKIHHQHGVLRIVGFRELSVVNAHAFREETASALHPHLDALEIDFSEATVVDSSGLGALVSLFKAANQINANGGVTMRLLNPPPPVQQVFELTRMHHLFEIVQQRDHPAGTDEPQAPEAPQKLGATGTAGASKTAPASRQPSDGTMTAP